jgi:hypothetical protein
VFETASRFTAMLLCDVAVVAGGAWGMWTSGVTNVVDGPVLEQSAVVLAMALVLVIRHLVSGRDTMAANTVMGLTVDRLLAIAHATLLAGVAVWWRISGEYYLGWLLTFAALVVIVGTALQLLVDVVTGRNARVDSRQERLLARRLTAVESWRIGLGLLGLAALVLSTPIHWWSPMVINLTIILIAIAVGISMLVRLGLRRLRTAAARS